MVLADRGRKHVIEQVTRGHRVRIVDDLGERAAAFEGFQPMVRNTAMLKASSQSVFQ